VRFAVEGEAVAVKAASPDAVAVGVIRMDAGIVEML
jgi:hypothetical protein